MKQLSIVIALCLSIIATSCDNNNDSDNFEQIMTFDQIYTVTGPDSKTSTYPTTQYTYKINHSKGTADIIVKNVRFSPMMPPTTMEFKNLSISYPNSHLSSTLIKIAGSDIIPEVQNTVTGKTEPMEGYTISSISGYIIPSQTSGPNSATLTFTINGVFTIKAYPIPDLYQFESITNVTGPGNQFSFNNAHYSINLNRGEGKVHLYLYNTKFAERMPAMNMIFKDIPVTFNSTGYKLNCESLIPCLNDSGATLMEDYPITNLSGSVTNGKLNLQFDCSINASGSSVEGITYHVTTSASNLPKLP